MRLYFLLLLLMPSFSNAQLIRSYGGVEPEGAYQLIQLPDSGFVINGSTRSYGPNNENIYTIRTNRFGDTLWTRVVGLGNESGYGVAYSSGSIYTTGYQLFIGSGNCETERWDVNGNLVWSSGFNATYPAMGRQVMSAPNNNLLIAGIENPGPQQFQGVTLFMIDTSGYALWKRRYTTVQGSMQFNDIDLCENGGYIVCGNLTGWNGSSNNAPDGYLMRLGWNGDTLWQRRYQTAPYITYFTCVKSLDDGGFIAGGLTYLNSAGVQDILVVRCDSTGDTLWTRVFGSVNPDYSPYILPMDDGGFLIAGQTADVNSANNWDIVLIRTDAMGDTLWTKTIGGAWHDVPRDMIRTSDGGVAILGISMSWTASGVYNDYDISLILLDGTLSTPCFGTHNPVNVNRCPLIIGSYYLYVQSGGTQSFHAVQPISGGDVRTYCTPLSTATVQQGHVLHAYPNPCDGLFTLEHLTYGSQVEICNSMGQIIFAEEAKETRMEIDLRGAAAGIYYCRVIEEESTWSTIMVKE